MKTIKQIIDVCSGYEGGLAVRVDLTVAQLKAKIPGLKIRHMVDPLELKDDDVVEYLVLGFDPFVSSFYVTVDATDFMLDVEGLDDPMANDFNTKYLAHFVQFFPQID